MQRRLSLLVTPANGSSVAYGGHYKANDIKPLAPALFPAHLAVVRRGWGDGGGRGKNKGEDAKEQLA